MLISTLSLASVVSFAYSVPRQVDPSTVQEQNPYPPDFVAYYGGFIRLLGSGNFTGALSQLNQSGLIHVPSSLRFVYDRFNSLLSTVTQQLQQVNGSISRIRSYLAQGDVNGANSTLQNAFFVESEANVTISQLESVAPQVGSSFGIPTGQLQSEVAALSRLEQSYVRILDQLSDQIVYFANGLQTGRIQPTIITLSASSNRVFLGQNLTLFGRLSASNGSSISGQSVQISSSYGESFAVATGAGGTFSATVTIPYLYQPSASFYASFSPASAVNASLLPSRSNLLDISLLFYTPSLTLSAPSSAYPDTSIQVNGTFGNSTISSLPQTITVLAFGGAVKANYSGGRFYAMVDVPPSLPSGQYLVTASSSALGDVAPANTSQPVQVVRVPSKVDVQTPNLIFGGQTLHISGYAESANGTLLSDAEVAVNVGGTSVITHTGENGSFDLSLGVPLFINVGSNQLWFVVSPSQPWVAPSARAFTVTALNLLVILVSVALAFAAGAVYVRRRRLTSSFLEASEQQLLQEAKPPAFGLPSKSITPVRSSYMNIVSMLETRGIRFRPSMTPREYLSKVSSELPVISNLFGMLTGAFEDDVYGYGSSEDAVHQARVTEQLIVGILTGRGVVE